MEYFHYVSTLDYVLLGFIALLIFWIWLKRTCADR